MYGFAPPWVLMAMGLLAGILSGVAFEACLKDRVASWKGKAVEDGKSAIAGPELSVPFAGICGGVTIFLAGGLQMFGTATLLSYLCALALTLLAAYLVWSQLSNLLGQLKQGDLSAVDLDTML